LFKGFELYLEAPRPDGWPFFLVPAVARGACVSLTSSLRNACKRFIPNEKVHPTNLLVRKWMHKKLINLTKDESKLKDMMVVIDAHSKVVVGHVAC
jgi:hypothetical protein